VEAVDGVPVDLLEELQAALAEIDSLLIDRTVSIEMARLRVNADPVLVRRAFGALAAHVLDHAEPRDSITVRVVRVDQTARVEVFNEGGGRAEHAGPDLDSVAEELRVISGEIGTNGPGEAVLGWMTLPLATGASSTPGS
jgi:hypothetical protein